MTEVLDNMKFHFETNSQWMTTWDFQPETAERMVEKRQEESIKWIKFIFLECESVFHWRLLPIKTREKMLWVEYAIIDIITLSYNHSWELKQWIFFHIGYSFLDLKGKEIHFYVLLTILSDCILFISLSFPFYKWPYNLIITFHAGIHRHFVLFGLMEFLRRRFSLSHVPHFTYFIELWWLNPVASTIAFV